MAAKVGVYGRFNPPLSAAVDYVVSCEQIGLDVVALTDQISLNHPNAVWPKLTASKFLPKQHNFLDASVVMALAADRISRIELFLGAIDVVRHSPSKLAQHFVTINHAAKGRA